MARLLTLGGFPGRRPGSIELSPQQPAQATPTVGAEGVGYLSIQNSGTKESVHTCAAPCKQPGRGSALVCCLALLTACSP